MRLSCLLLSTSVLLVSSNISSAATQDEADAVKASIEKFVGATPGVVSVKPEADGFKLILDAAPLISKINQPGVSAAAAPVHLKIKSLGNGKWQFENNEPWSLTVKSGNEIAFDYKIGNLNQSGLWDESLGGIAELKFEARDYSVFQNIIDPRMNARNSTKTRLPAMTGALTGTLSPNGGVDLVANYVMKNYFAETEVTPQSGGQPFRFSYNVTAMDYKSSAKAFRQMELSGLLSWFIAHPSIEAIRADQNSLKPLLVAALPLFENLSGEIAAKTVAIKTTLGDAKLDKITALVDINGLHKDGRFRESIEFEGLKLPDSILPPWSVKLMPKQSKIDFSVTGFDAETVSKMAIESFDLSKQPPIPAETTTKIVQAIAPNGTLTVFLNPSVISSQLYALHVDGELKVSLAGQMPTGKATLRLNGFDRTIKTMQDAAASEPSVQQVIGALLAAKGFSKSAGDDLVWVIESSGAGQILVNGVDLGKM